MKLMKKLIKKLFAGKKIAKKRAKRAKRRAKVLGLGFAFCAGAVCTGYFVYTHREALAASVAGKAFSKRRHGHFLLRKLLKKKA